MLKKSDVLTTIYGSYSILEQVGSGGNGTVYKAKTEDNEIVAVKAITKKLSREKIKRFKNEINFCEKHDNKRIVKVLDRGYSKIREEEYLFYVMPLYQSNLREEIRKGILIEKAEEYFIQICEGLKYAHNCECIHRDIKPENILISNDGNCVIADFGIAHFIDEDKVTMVETKESSRLANFTYHAPEQINSYKLVTPATDIFALGLILNEMITKRVPAGDNYKKVEEFNPTHKYIDLLVKKMISQEPKDRYQSIKELIIDWQARKKESQNLAAIKDLSHPLLVGEASDYLTEKPIEIIDIKFENGTIVINLTNEPNDNWEYIYNQALSSYTSMPVCYKNFRFFKHTARYDIKGNLEYLT